MILPRLLSICNRVLHHLCQLQLSSTGGDTSIAGFTWDFSQIAGTQHDLWVIGCKDLIGRYKIGVPDWK